MALAVQQSETLDSQAQGSMFNKFEMFLCRMIDRMCYKSIGYYVFSGAAQLLGINLKCFCVA
jgi:hypothetical protein